MLTSTPRISGGSGSGGGGAIVPGTTPVTGGTVGSVLFVGTGPVLQQDNANFFWDDTNNLLGIGTATPTSALHVSPNVRTTGSASYVRFITPADTTLTASTESIGIQFGGNTSAATVTRQFATGALATQREYVFVAPTYAFAGASVISSASTFYISGAPALGTNASWSNATTSPNALYVASGQSRFDGVTAFYGGINATLLTLNNNSTVGWGNTASIYGGGPSVGIIWQAAGQLRVSNAGTGGGQLLIGGSSATTLGAQAHVVSTAAGTVGLRVDSAASPSTDIFQVTINGTANSGLIVTSTGAPSALGSGATSERFGSGTTVGTNGTAIGNGASAVIGGAGTYNGAIAIGKSANAAGSGTDGISIGNSASTAFVNGGIAIGHSSSAQGISLGHGVTSGANEFVVGGPTYPTSNVYFGKNVIHATPTVVTINPTGASGTNIAGVNLQLAGGKATGNAAGGGIAFQTSDVGASGTTLQSLTTKMTLSQAGNLTVTGSLLMNGVVTSVSSAGTLTLDATANCFVFSGTTTTWTLPAVSGTTNRTYFIKNRGSGSITLNANAGATEIYDTSAVTSITITAGTARILINDGTYFTVQ